MRYIPVRNDKGERVAWVPTLDKNRKWVREDSKDHQDCAALRNLKQNPNPKSPSPMTPEMIDKQIVYRRAGHQKQTRRVKARSQGLEACGICGKGLTDRKLKWCSDECRSQGNRIKRAKIRLTQGPSRPAKS